MHRAFPQFIKAPWIRYRQRSLAILPWSDFPSGKNGTDRIAIVGNAGYLARIDQGALVDGHDLVIRLNNFATAGFKKQVGSRCDIFLTSFFTDIRFERPELAGVEQIVGSVPNAFRKARRLSLHHRHAEHIVDGMQRLDRRTVYAPTLSMFLKARDMCGAVPSTGLMALLFALQVLRWQELFVTGFSFFRGEEHYFDGVAAPRPRHDFERERLLFAELLLPLIGEGRVRTDVVLQDDLLRAGS